MDTPNNSLSKEHFMSNYTTTNFLHVTTSDSTLSNFSAENLESSNTTEKAFLVPDDCMVVQTQFMDFIPWNNPRSIISEKVDVMTDSVVSSFLLPLLFLVSTPTNILSMIVFYKQGLKERINLCVFFQSFADVSYMIINYITFADRLYSEINGLYRLRALMKFMLNNNLQGFFGLSWASGFMTMLIACERCFCVVSPLKAQRLFKTKTTLIIIIVAFVVIVGGFFFVGTVWYMQCMFDPNTGASWLALYPSPFYLRHRKAIDALYGYVYGVVLPATFFFTIVITTVITVVKLKEFSSWREKTTSTSTTLSARDVSVTRMLIGCSVQFIACNVLGVGFRVCVLVLPDLNPSGHYRNFYSFMATLSKMCNYINFTCNFFIYYTMGTRYKKTLQAILCCVNYKTSNRSSVKLKSQNSRAQPAHFGLI